MEKLSHTLEKRFECMMINMPQYSVASPDKILPNHNEYVSLSNDFAYFALIASVLENTRLQFGYSFHCKNDSYCTILTILVITLSYNYCVAVLYYI